MKKILCAAILTAAVVLPIIARAQVVAPPPVAPIVATDGSGISGGPILWPMVGFLALAGFTEYADANGIAFPLCNHFGLKCYTDDGKVIGQ